MDETFKKQKQRTRSLLSKLSTKFIKLQKVAGGGPGAAASLGSLSPGAAKLILQQFGAAGAAPRATTSNSTSTNGTSSLVVASNSSTSCAGLPQAVQNQTDVLGDLVSQLSVRATSISPTTTPAAQGKSPVGGVASSGAGIGLKKPTTADTDEPETPASNPPLVTEEPDDSADGNRPGEQPQVRTGSPATLPSVATTSAAPLTTKSAVETTTTVALGGDDSPGAEDASKKQPSTGAAASDENSTATNTSSSLSANPSSFDDADVLPQVDESGPIIPAKLVDVHGHTRGFAMVRATAVASSAAHGSLQPPTGTPSFVGRSLASTRPLAINSSAAGSGQLNVGVGMAANREPSDAEVATAAATRTRVGFNDSWPMLPSSGWYFHNGISS